MRFLVLEGVILINSRTDKRETMCLNCSNLGDDDELILPSEMVKEVEMPVVCERCYQDTKKMDVDAYYDLRSSYQWLNISGLAIERLAV